jgi:hypothetical protein
MSDQELREYLRLKLIKQLKNLPLEKEYKECEDKEINTILVDLDDLLQSWKGEIRLRFCNLRELPTEIAEIIEKKIQKN